MGPDSGVGLGVWLTGGCGAKINRADLMTLLAGFGTPDRSKDLQIGLGDHDDAAVFALTDDRSLVATLDFSPPVSRDPAFAGTIAAVNALNDIWACGGQPAFCLSILGIPRVADLTSFRELLTAASSVCQAERAVLAGGHTIHSPEPLFGLAVLGFVNPATTWMVAGARPGDVLLLTKPVGVGVLISRARRDAAAEAALRNIADDMTLTHSSAVDVLHDVAVHAATDVSGFGLSGHAADIAESSGVTILLDAGQVPVHDAARELFAAGHSTSITGPNSRDDRVEIAGLLDRVQRAALSDPQTAGPLLLAVPESAAEHATALLRRSGYGSATAVGRVVERGTSPVVVSGSPPR